MEQALKATPAAGGRRESESELGGLRSVSRVRVRTLVLIRWLAVLGQFTTMLVVSEFLDASWPVSWAMAAVACSVVINLWYMSGGRLRGWHSDREAGILLAYDLLQLAVLLYLTGGLQNPFAILMLVPVTISASLLSFSNTIGLGLIAVAVLGVLAHYYLPLPWNGALGHIEMPVAYVQGTWMALTLGMVFIMFYSWRVAEESRRMSDALAETQLILAREQQLASLGGLAAATAHELGTPLGTIALIAKELSQDLPADSDQGADIRLLLGQAERCRDILARLAKDPLEGRDTAFDRLPLVALIDSVLEPHRLPNTSLRIAATGERADEPQLQRVPELVQGLGNLVENALDFAHSEVVVEVHWNSSHIELNIVDDGPGFAAEIVDFLGEPYISSRRAQGGMGLGVFIAKTLLERTGAYVGFQNRRRLKGALVQIRWPRQAIEIAGKN